MNDTDFDIFQEDRQVQVVNPEALGVRSETVTGVPAGTKPDLIPADAALDQSFHPITLTDDHFNQEIEGEINRAMLKQEMHNADVCINNIHRMFNYAPTVPAFNSLIRSSLLVQKQRRASLEHAMKLKLAAAVQEFEYDLVTGELLRK